MRFRRALGLVLAAALVAACGGDVDPDPSGTTVDQGSPMTTTAGDPTATSEPDSPATTPPAGEMGEPSVLFGEEIREVDSLRRCEPVNLFTRIDVEGPGYEMVIMVEDWGEYEIQSIDVSVGPDEVYSGMGRLEEDGTWYHTGSGEVMDEVFTITEEVLRGGLPVYHRSPDVDPIDVLVEIPMPPLEDTC